jgi:hypothetical protein
LDATNQLESPAPPAPPTTPPSATGTTGPSSEPPRRPHAARPWVIAGLALLVVAMAGAGVTWAIRGGAARQSGSAQGGEAAFASAMRKAGVSASAPHSPAALTSVKPSGSHEFEATFTGAELSGLMNAFTYETTLQGMTLSLSRVAVSFAGGNTVSLSGQVNAGGSSYAGTASAPVVFESGKIALAGDATIDAEGMRLGGAQAQQATDLLLSYANSYLAAAPGLRIASAQITPGGVHVKGTAPDTLSY